MADAVAPGDGAEEIAAGAGQAAAAGQSDEPAESEHTHPGRADADAASEPGIQNEPDAASAAEPEPEPESGPESAAEPEFVLVPEPLPPLAPESASSPQPDPEPGPDAAATQIIAPIPAPGASEPAAPAQQPAAPVQALPQAVASASFVPSPPSQPSAERSAVTLAGRRFDRRAALVAGGVGVVVIGGAVAALASSGGSGGTNTASGTGHAGAGATGRASTAVSVPLPTITTNPADGASGVDPSKPITVKVLNGTIDSVQLSGQDQTSGTLSTDGTSWTSANALDVNATYRLTIVAKNSAGKTKSSTVSFHTLKPSATFGVSSVVPPRGSTVGVGQPIRVTFSNYVPGEYRAALEQACVVRTDPPVAGAWYWVSNSTDGAVLDWRPKDFWPVNTKVSVEFNLNGVRLGQHQFGVKDYSPHEFTIRDTDLRLIVDKDKFTATCYRNGQVIRTFPIDTGQTTAETFVTYTGTMAVLGKGNPVEMKGNYGPNDTYDDFVNWATQITWSGTYVHAAPWDPEIGHANDDSHGCVHCRTSDAEWFYNLVSTGDVVTINGKRKREVAVSNGICTFTLDWATLLKGSAYGPTVNGKPTAA